MQDPRIIAVKSSSALLPRGEWFWIGLGFLLTPIAKMSMWLRR